jgi:hypothetical protein
MNPLTGNRFGLIADLALVFELLPEDGLCDVCGREALTSLGSAFRGGAGGAVGRATVSDAGI